MSRCGDKAEVGESAKLVLIETGARPTRRGWREATTAAEPNFQLIDCRPNLFEALNRRRRVPLPGSCGSPAHTCRGVFIRQGPPLTTFFKTRCNAATLC